MGSLQCMYSSIDTRLFDDMALAGLLAPTMVPDAKYYELLRTGGVELRRFKSLLEAR